VEKEMITLGALEAELANASPSEPLIQLRKWWISSLYGVATQIHFLANDGKMRFKAFLPKSMASEVIFGKLQNWGSFILLSTLATTFLFKGY
jgi:hypothetical protein